MTYTQHASALLALGLPLVGSAVAGFLIHMTDTILLGWYDVISLAAATIATSFWFITFIVGAGFGNAVAPMVAGAVAAGDLTRARRVTRMALWLSLAYGFVAVAILWNAEAIFLAIGQTPDVAAEGQRFLRIAVWGMFPALAVNVLRNYLSAQHLTSVQLWVTVAAIFANAGLAYALIFGHFGLPELGIRGAAIGSVIIQSLTLLALAIYADWRLPEAALFQRIWRSDNEALRDVFRLGLPIGLTSLAESSLFTASAVMMGWIGEYPLAAHGIALQLTALMFMFHVGMSQAATVRAGGAYGRRDEDELKRIAKTALAVSFSFGFFAVLLFVLAPEPLVVLFLDPEEPARDIIVPLGVTLMFMAALFQFVDAAQIVALSLLRGVQDTTVPMWLAIISYWVIGFPASYLFAFTFGFGPAGLWLGLTTGLGCAAGLLMWRFWGRSVRIGQGSVVV
jgi:MATE family multidrug resistance protein